LTETDGRMKEAANPLFLGEAHNPQPIVSEAITEKIVVKLPSGQ